jgi:hypothetical protein
MIMVSLGFSRSKGDFFLPFCVKSRKSRCELCRIALKTIPQKVMRPVLAWLKESLAEPLMLNASFREKLELASGKSSLCIRDLLPQFWLLSITLRSVRSLVVGRSSILSLSVRSRFFMHPAVSVRDETIEKNMSSVFRFQPIWLCPPTDTSFRELTSTPQSQKSDFLKTFRSPRSSTL